MGKNDQSGKSLTPKQQQLIALLLTGVNVATAAKQLEIADKTARRWLVLPLFQQTYRAVQRSLFDEALQTLQRKIGKAIDTLDRNMDADTSPANVQVRAAQIVLEQALEVGKISELETRLIDLENQLKERGIEGNAIRRVK